MNFDSVDLYPSVRKFNCSQYNISLALKGKYRWQDGLDTDELKELIGGYFPNQRNYISNLARSEIERTVKLTGGYLILTVGQKTIKSIGCLNCYFPYDHFNYNSWILLSADCDNRNNLISYTKAFNARCPLYTTKTDILKALKINIDFFAPWPEDDDIYDEELILEIIAKYPSLFSYFNCHDNYTIALLACSLYSTAFSHVKTEIIDKNFVIKVAENFPRNIRYAPEHLIDTDVGLALVRSIEQDPMIDYITGYLLIPNKLLMNKKFLLGARELSSKFRDFITEDNIEYPIDDYPMALLYVIDNGDKNSSLNGHISYRLLNDSDFMHEIYKENSELAEISAGPALQRNPHLYKRIMIKKAK